jgi:5-methyltetrahydropteroyltriglutamate--homocysteine methyltransferase
VPAKALPLFPASIVGSIPRPLVVRELIEKASWDATDANTMDAAIRFVVAMQERAGLDVVNDGEWRRRSYIGVIAELAHGFTLETNPADGRPWTVVTERLSPKPAGFIANEAAFVKKIATVATKITLPAPALLGERLWDPERSRKAYPDRAEFVRACVAPLRAEIALLQDLGVDIVQIDDPHLCLFVDPDVRRRYDDPDRAADFAVEMINETVAGFAGVKFAVHLCRRAGARVRGEKHHAGTYGPILPQLNRLKVQHLTMEFTAAAARSCWASPRTTTPPARSAPSCACSTRASRSTTCARPRSTSRSPALTSSACAARATCRRSAAIRPTWCATPWATRTSIPTAWC